MNAPRHRKYARGEVATSFAFLAPTFIGIVLFSLVPLCLSFFDSFFNYGFYQPRVYVGIDNYVRVFEDKYFWNSILVGFKFVALVVPSELIISFLFAHAIKNLSRRTSMFVKAAIIVPMVVPGVIASLVFVYIFDYQGGLLNNILKLFGVPLQAWFQDKHLAMFSIAAPRVWLAFGYMTLITLGALLDIPETFFEAARIDGAGAWRRMISITLPSMRNIILFLLVSGIVAAMQEFDMPYNMTGGGPARSTETPALFIYTHFINDATIGFSLATAMLVALVLGSASAVIFRVIRPDKSSE